MELQGTQESFKRASYTVLIGVRLRYSWILKFSNTCLSRAELPQHLLVLASRQVSSHARVRQVRHHLGRAQLVLLLHQFVSELDVLLGQSDLSCTGFPENDDESP